MYIQEEHGDPSFPGENKEEGWYAIRQRAHHALTHFAPEPDAAGQWQHAGHWALLAADLWETPDSVEVSLEIPGTTPDQLDVEVQSDVLLVRGIRAPDEEGGRHFLRERAYGRFERAFHLPAAVDEAQARARYLAGILRISLPKLHGRRDNRVTVEGA